MGKNARIPIGRLCKSCGEMMYVSAKDLQEHSQLCKRAKISGLILPSRPAKLGF